MPKHIHRAILIVALLAVTALAGCRDLYEWRQKLTVTVATPQGDRTGTSVSSVRALFGPVWLAATEVSYRLSGEAVVVELPDRHVLVALIDHDGQAELLASAFKDKLPASRKEWLQLIAGLKGVASVPDKALPVFVLFRDPSTPASARIVPPDAFRAELGQGYALKSVTVGITAEPETFGRVKDVLPWSGKRVDQAMWEHLPQAARDAINGLFQGRE